MKPSDLFIRGRQFFGFLIPGVMWSATIMMILQQSPLAFVEAGNPLIRSALFIGISYIVGFVIQTLIFPLTADRMKKRIRQCPPADIKSVEKLKGQLKELFDWKLPTEKKALEVPDDDFTSFCKLYVLENSSTVGRFLLEKEDDINFMVAHLVSGPVFLLVWMYSRGYGWWKLVVAAAVMVAFVYRLRKRLYFYLQREIIYTYEACLVTHLEQSRQRMGKVYDDKVLGGKDDE
jgi:hypothetical protein